MLAIEEPSVRLEQVRGVPNVGREGAVLSSHAVDLKRELDRNGEPLELPREARHGGSAEALTVEDEPVTPRLPHEIERDVAAPVLERLGEEAPAPELERDLPNSFGLVVPGVAPTEEAHHQARVFWHGPGRLEVLDADAGTPGGNQQRRRHEANVAEARHGGVDRSRRLR